LRAAIFDMDGLLVDSEPLWQIAEVETFARVGVAITKEQCRETKGLFVVEAAQHWFDRYPWEGPSVKEVAAWIIDAVIALVLERGELLPGASECLERFVQKGWPLALASSSEHRLIKAVVERFSLATYFSAVHSAEDEPYGKPHPGVFLSAADALRIHPVECLVFEDSPAGVLAAKAARMSVVAVPEPFERGRPAFSLADAVLHSLVEVDDALLSSLGAAF